MHAARILVHVRVSSELISQPNSRLNELKFIASRKPLRAIFFALPAAAMLPRHTSWLPVVSGWSLFSDGEPIL